jgi:hypothetical protein
MGGLTAIDLICCDESVNCQHDERVPWITVCSASREEKGVQAKQVLQVERRQVQVRTRVMEHRHAPLEHGHPHVSDTHDWYPH